MDRGGLRGGSAHRSGDLVFLKAKENRALPRIGHRRIGRGQASYRRKSSPQMHVLRDGQVPVLRQVPADVGQGSQGDRRQGGDGQEV